MIRPGFVIESPATRTRAVVIESDAETSGMGWLLKVTCAPNAGPNIADHLHLSWTETFEILSGNAYYEIDGTRKTARAGESFTARPRQRHVHPWNAGDDELVFCQRTVFAEPNPQAVRVFIRST
jgi:quercetin dioxygenase-like cupin family protein